MRNPTASARPHFTRNASLWQARLRVPLFLMLLTLVYFWPQLAQGRVLYWGDIGLYFTPMAGFLRENLRAGRVPLWNPLIFCGTPYAGNPQTWPLYPVTALLPFVSAPYFLNLTIALHVWLAGVGAYLFARRALTIGRGGALLAALTFMFGGQLVSKEQFPNMVQAAAWLPWALWALDRVLRQRRVRDALTLGLALGLQLLAAHAQMTLLTLYLAAAWGVFVCLSPPAPNNGGAENKRHASGESFWLPHYWGRGGLLLLSLTAALGLAAGQILPTLALFRDASRQKLSFPIVNRFFLPGHQLGNFVLPDLHGHPYWGDWTGRGNFWETCCYVGWLSFGLAVWGGVAAWRRGGASAARFWTGVFGFGVWMALGGSGGLYHLAYFVLPGFRSFHDPARCLLWACFALSLLAGYGWENLIRRASPPPSPSERRSIQTAAGPHKRPYSHPLLSEGEGENKREGEVRSRRSGVSALILLLAFADLTYFGRTLYPLAAPSALFPSTPNIAAVRSDPDVQDHQARILAPTAGVWLRFTSLRSFRQDVPGYQTLWADTLTPNLTMPYGLPDAYGYEPVALKDAQTVDGKASAAFDPKSTPAARAAAASLAGALGVKFIAVCRVSPPEATLPGMILVRAAPTLAPPGPHSGAAAKIYLSRNVQWQPRAHLEGSAVPVTLRDEGPDRVTLTCVTDSPARLVLADTQAAGWRATADGQPTRIETYGGSLRTVRLPGPGTHRVVFSYSPTPYRLGLYISLLTLTGLMGAAAFGVTRKIARQAGIGHGGVE